MTAKHPLRHFNQPLRTAVKIIESCWLLTSSEDVREGEEVPRGHVNFCGDQ